MNLDLQSRPFPITPALADAVETQLETIAQRFGSRVSSISVRLDDVNGKRGGIDKRCRIVVRMARHRSVVGQALSDDLYHAISLAARRAETALGRRRERTRSFRPLVPAMLQPGIQA